MFKGSLWLYVENGQQEGKVEVERPVIANNSGEKNEMNLFFSWDEWAEIGGERREVREGRREGCVETWPMKVSHYGVDIGTF